MAEQAHRALVRPDEAHQDANGGALAGAIRAHETHDLPGRELQRNVLEREEPVLPAHVPHFHDQRVTAHFFSALRSALRTRAISSSASMPTSFARRAAATRWSSSSCCCRFIVRPRLSATNEPLPCWVTITPSLSSSA